MSVEFKAFEEVVGSMFALPSDQALSLRRLLGTDIDQKFQMSPKGKIELRKRRFIDFACRISGVQWTASERHRIISNLKNTGNGDERMTRALFFLCYKTSDFEGVRRALIKSLGRDVAAYRELQGWPPAVEFAFSDLIDEGVSALDTEAPRATVNELENGADRAEASGLSRMGLEKDDERSVGRRFLETSVTPYLYANSEFGTGTLAIADIDDLTKINKVYGRTVGDQVIEIVRICIESVAGSRPHQAGRCGDDTFYLVFPGVGIEIMIDIARRFVSQVEAYDWAFEAPGLRVSASAGIAAYKTAEPSIDFALRAAIGMTTAKENGGNQVAHGPEYLANRVRLARSTYSVWS